MCVEKDHAMLDGGQHLNIVLVATGASDTGYSSHHVTKPSGHSGIGGELLGLGLTGDSSDPDMKIGCYKGS